MSSVVNGSGDGQDGQSSRTTSTTSHTAQESGLASTAGLSQATSGPKSAMTWAERLAAGSSSAKRANAAVQAQATSSTSTSKDTSAADMSQRLSNVHLDSGAGSARQGRPDQAVPDTNITVESASAATGRTRTATDSGWGESSENGSKKDTAEISSTGATSGAGTGQSIPATTMEPPQAVSSPEPALKAYPAPPKPNIWQIRRQEAEKKLAEQAAQREKDASAQPPSAPADPVPSQQSEGATASKKKTKAQRKKDSSLEKGSPANGTPSANQGNAASWPSPLEEKARGEERESRERESRERQREDSTAQSASSTGTSSPSVEKRKPNWKSIQPEISFTSALPSRQSATGATGQRNGSRSPRQIKAPYSNKAGDGSSSAPGVSKAPAKAKSAPSSTQVVTFASKDGLEADSESTARPTDELSTQVPVSDAQSNAPQEPVTMQRDAPQNAGTASTEQQNQPPFNSGQARMQRGPYPMGPNFQSPEISSRMQQAGLPAKPDWTARAPSGATSPAPRPRLAPAGQSHQSSSSASIASATSQSNTGQSTSSSTPVPDASATLSTGTETAPSSDISATAPSTSHAQHSQPHGHYQQPPYYNQRGRRGMSGMGSRGGRGGFAQTGRNLSMSRGTDGQYQGNVQYHGYQQGYPSNKYQSQPYRWNSSPQSAPFSLPPQDPRQGLHQQAPYYPEPVPIMPPYQQPYYPQPHMQPPPGAFYPPPPSSDFGSPPSQHQMLPNTGFSGMQGYAPQPGPSSNSMQVPQQPPPPPFAFERPAPLYDYSGYPFPNDGGTAFFVLGQIEFYFSSDSLARDSWMRQRMDAEGWIDIGLVAAFKRLKMLTSDIDLVREMMNVSYMCEVRENKVRTRDWQRWILPGAAAPSWTANAQPVSQTSDEAQKQSSQDDRSAVGQQPNPGPAASTGISPESGEPVSSA